MSRKYIDSKTKKQYKRLSRFDDELKHITEIGPKIPEFEQTLEAPRDLRFEDIGTPMDVDDILTMKIMEVVNAAKETRQYVEDANIHIDEQNRRINMLKNLNSTFENQIRALKSEDKKIKL